ncbi:hypothetical protein SJ753_00450 [Enterobacter kobei]|uniref:hypothetical protein n=1 Tax=Enterobacter kobei TaxID=208224 RepID=UPI0029DD757B|nr:hypothetical protein [Enterobacter kobei]MDX7584970.1 hypothetical protein [Enterobacter kobei]
MSTITREFTKEQLQQIEAAAKEVLWPVVWSEKKAREHFSEKITPKVVLKLARIALASLEAEAVCVIDQSNLDYLKSGSDADVWPASRTEMGDVLLYRAAPPAPVSVPDNVTAEDCPAFIKYDLTEVDEAWARGFNACRAAMHQGAQPVSDRDELPDDFDFDRFNDVVWLEAVASNPHMHSPTTSTIAMVALELNKKLADGKPELTVWYGSMPESNGKANWTAILHRKGEGRCMDGFTIDRSEYPGRVLYAADRVRYLIGEKSERPSILDYDADAHSGYVKPGNSPVIPDGWVMVPVEPTAEMLQSGISAHYERSQIQIHDRPAPGPMECAYVAMLAAAPQQEVK